MSGALKRFIPIGLVAAASVWICQIPSVVGDYGSDAAPAINALAGGHVGDFLRAQPLMGPFSILVRAPFAAAGGSELAAYRLGALPCVFAAGLLGLYLAGIARRRGSSPLAQTLIVALCLFNPLTFEALKLGHPEEILTAALAVGAVAVAAEGHGWRATVLLGLALATKQWAVIAILPVLLALPAARIRAAAGAAAIAIAIVLTLPGFLAAPAEFVDMQGNAASSRQIVGPWSVWYAAAPEVTQKVNVGGEPVAVQRRLLPEVVGSLTHPLIVMTALLLPLALAARRGRFGISGADAMALLAMIGLLRAGLDPVNNVYYHEPFLLAVIGWDAMTARGLPVRALAACGVATLFARWGTHLDPLLFNALYTSAFITAVAALSVVLFRRAHAPRVVPIKPAVAVGVPSR